MQPLHTISTRWISAFVRRATFVASALLFSSAALADPPVIKCVTTVEQLFQALELASSGETNNAVENYINVATGTYSLNNTILDYGSSNTKAIHLTGGFNSTCTKQLTTDPRFTVITGVAGSKVLMISNSAGPVWIESLTFKGGKVTSGGSALSMNTAGAVGEVVLGYNIFTDNTGGDAVVDIGGSSTAVIIDNNLFYGNDAFSATVQAGRYAGVNTPIIYMTNNTLTQNSVDGGTMTSSVIIAQIAGAGAIAALSNNIVYNNQIALLTRDIYVAGTGNAQLNRNVFGSYVNAPTVTVTQDNNLSIDPQFVSSTDFHLQPTSVAIGFGKTTPPGGLTTYDLDGNDRTYSSTVDIGAYERGDEIFADGFEF